MLDEGIDIPACKEAFILASTRNERQFIQRRGRVLRKAKNKKYAIIYDYIISLPSYFKGQNENAYINLLEGEFKRVVNFSLISMNKAHALEIIKNFLTIVMLRKYLKKPLKMKLRDLKMN